MDIQMIFEFSNNVFSGMLSLFAAVIGLAYPFILQIVERIRNLYVTEKVVDWFQQEKTLCHFLLLLKINIPLAILIPYLLFLSDEISGISITLLTIQSGFVCALLCYLIRLYDLVNIYSSYIRMAKYTQREDLERLAIIMLSADHKDEEEAYATARDKLYGRITEILIEAAHKKSGSLEEYPAEIMQVVGTILSAAREKGKYRRTSCDTNSIPLLYDAIFNKAHPTKGLRKFIWYHLNMLLKAGNTEWLKSYWEWASQFYRTMRYDRNYNDAERIDFYEMHIFFAAMVLRCKNQELMEHIMNYQDASPEPPCLLLSRFNKIIELLLKYDKLRSWPYKLVEPYQMYFFTNDVNADNNIFRVLCDYLAFSLLSRARKGAYSTDNDDYKIGQQQSKEELESEKRTLEWFRVNVLVGGICKIFEQHFTTEEINEADERMIQLKKTLEDRIKEITVKDDISQKKLKAMRDEIIRQNKKNPIPLAKKEMDGEDVEKREFLAQVKAEASPGQLMEHQNINSVNFGDVLIAYLRNQFYHRLGSIFLLNGAVKTYLIQYNDIRQALKNIGFQDGEYILLNNGISLWNYDIGDVNESDIITIGSGNNYLLVVKRENCPTYTFGDIDKEKGYKELDKENGLYWIEPTKENGLTVQVAQSFVIYERTHTRYIKINVTYDRALGACDLNKLKDIKTIL